MHKVKEAGEGDEASGEYDYEPPKGNEEGSEEAGGDTHNFYRVLLLWKDFWESVWVQIIFFSIPVSATNTRYVSDPPTMKR